MGSMLSNPRGIKSNVLFCFFAMIISKSSFLEKNTVKTGSPK